MKQLSFLMRYLGLAKTMPVVLYLLLRKAARKTEGRAVELYRMLSLLIRSDSAWSVSGNNLEVRWKGTQGMQRMELRKNSSDINVFNQIFERQEYQALVMLIRSFPHITIHNIIDAGANIGLTTIYLHGFFSGAFFVAIEPDGGNAAVLERNMKLNGIQGVILCKGLWSSSQPLVVTTDFRDSREWSRQVRVADPSTDSSLLTGVTVEDIMKDQQWGIIDLFKIDIEGAEREVFADHDRSLSILSRVKFLVVELHDEVDFRRDFEGLLREAGFGFFMSGESLVGFNRRLTT